MSFDAANDIEILIRLLRFTLSSYPSALWLLMTEVVWPEAVESGDEETP